MSPIKLKSKPKSKAKAKSKAKPKSKLSRIQQKILNQAKNLLSNDNKSYRIISPKDFLNEKTIDKILNKIGKYDLQRIFDWAEADIVAFDSRQRKTKDSKDSKHRSVLINKILKQLEKKQISIIELKPQQRSIVINFEFSLFNDNEHQQTSYLDFPYIQFIRFPIGTYVSCSNKPVTDWDSVIGYLPLPNGGEESLETYVCFGSSPKTPEDVINAYFSRKFNSELSYYLSFPKEIKNFRIWEKNTRLNPGFSLGVSWNDDMTVGEAIIKNVTGLSCDYY